MFLFLFIYIDKEIHKSKLNLKELLSLQSLVFYLFKLNKYVLISHDKIT